jgi:transposase
LRFKPLVTELPDLSHLSHAEKDALALGLWAQVQALTAQVQRLTARVAELEAQHGAPPKTPDNSSLPPSAGKKARRSDSPKRARPRQGSVGRRGGGRALVAAPDETVIARPMRCAHCQAALDAADQRLAARYDKVDLPLARPPVTRAERHGGQCRHCGRTPLAPVPEGPEPGTPFSPNVVALAIYLRVVRAISYRRLARLMVELVALAISEGALDAAVRRAVPGFDAEVGAILARLRRARVVCSDETGVRADGKPPVHLPRLSRAWRRQ